MKIQVPNHLDLDTFRFSHLPNLTQTGQKAREAARKKLEEGIAFDNAVQKAVEEILQQEKSELKPGGRLRLLETEERHRILYFLQIEDDTHYSDAGLLELALLRHLKTELQEDRLRYEHLQTKDEAKPYATPSSFERERIFQQFQDQLHSRARFELKNTLCNGVEKNAFISLCHTWLLQQEIEMEVADYIHSHIPHSGSVHEKLLPDLLLFLRAEFPHLYSVKKKRKWWNPLTWF